MKKTHIIGILLIAASICVILSTLVDASTYSGFSDIKDTPGKEVQVIGELDKSKELVYNPEENANLFIFHMVDKEGYTEEVHYSGNKPQDFERSEELVVTGYYKKGTFHASKILMKCPSKYNNGETVEVSADATAI